MNSQDWADIDNVRGQAISQLAEVCAAMGLSWSATEKQFTIELPNVVISRGGASVAVNTMPTIRKTFDISTWGDTQADDPEKLIPDDMQLPDYGEILDEGVPPQGDKNAES